jgi:hypothetical protein
MIRIDLVDSISDHAIITVFSERKRREVGDKAFQPH